MRTRRIHQLCFAWLAFGVLLLSAMASAITPAVHAARGDAWVEVCTLAGSKWVNADGSSAEAGSHAPGQGSSPGQHCPWCSQQVPALALPDAVPTHWGASARSALVPLPAPPPPPLARAWALVPSRAPPAHS